MKYLIAAIASVCLSAPAVFADGKSDVIGSAYGSAKGQGEWVKVDSSCPKAGIGKQQLVLHCNASQPQASMDLNFKTKPTKGFENVDIYFKRLPSNVDRFTAALIFDAGNGGQKRPLFKLDKFQVVQEGAYSKATIDKSMLDFKDDFPLTQVIVSFSSLQAPNPSGAEMGALIVNADSGQVMPADIELDISDQPAVVSPPPMTKKN